MAARLAVGAVVFREDLAVLLVRRARPPLAGRWSLPGGKVQPGEGLAEAVVRELLEETGLTVVPGALVEVLTLAREGFVYEIHDFLCTLAPGVSPAAVQAGDDASEARFWSPEELSLAGAEGDVLRVVASALRLLLGA